MIYPALLSNLGIPFYVQPGGAVFSFSCIYHRRCKGHGYSATSAHSFPFPLLPIFLIFPLLCYLVYLVVPPLEGFFF